MSHLGDAVMQFRKKIHFEKNSSKDFPGKLFEQKIFSFSVSATTNFFEIHSCHFNTIWLIIEVTTTTISKIAPIQTKIL